jgi:predicted Holliday junction resolvase-like endonuclease
MKTDYLYISIAIVTLIINIILVATLIKMSSEKKQKDTKASYKNSNVKPKIKRERSVDNTEDVASDNLSYFDAESKNINKEHDQVSNNEAVNRSQHTVLLDQNQYTEVLRNDNEQPK